MRIILSLFVVLVVLLVTAGCGSDDSAALNGDGKERTKVVAAFYPLAWAAEQVGGDDVDVENITPPGVEPHDLELTPQVVASIEQADVVLYIGGGFQPAVEEAIERSDATKIDVLEAEGLKLLDASGDDGHGHADEKDSDEHAGEERVDEDSREGEDALESDPHVWLDPVRFAIITEHVAEELDAEATDTVEALNELHGEFESGLETCERREMFTSHSAFGYLADRYELEQVSISGLSPDAEPLPRDLKRVAEEAEEHGATTIFFETLVSPRLSEQVANEVGARTAVLDPLEGIDQDRLDDGVDYLDVMRDNLDALRTGLDCA